MSTPLSSERSLRLVYLVVGVGVGLVLGVVLPAALSLSSGGSTSPSNPTTGGPPAPGGPGTAPVNVTSTCNPPPPDGGIWVASCNGVVSNGSPVRSLPFDAPSGSLILVFVSFVNFEIGGGSIESIGDSLGDTYVLAASTGLSLNHTEDLFAATSSAADPAEVVSVSFAAGAAPQGGSVAVVDVANATLASLDTNATAVGLVSPASVTVSATRPGDLFLLGAAGRGVAGPFGPGRDETLLDTGTATGGPFEDGVAYGTFEAASASTTVTLSADLNTSTFWEAIGVAIAQVPIPPPVPTTSTCSPPPAAGSPEIVSCTGVVFDSPTVTTLPFAADPASLVLVFVTYANFEVGGGSPQLVTDSIGSTYVPVESTGSYLNHTVSLFATSLATGSANLTVSVSFSGGAAPQGGGVAVVDVANASAASIDAVAATFGYAGPANVTLNVTHSGDLFLIGAGGRGASGPFTATPGEELLDTGTATAGPYEDGVAYGTAETTSAHESVLLSENLNVSTYWAAVGVAIANESEVLPPSGPPAVVSHAAVVNNLTTVTTPVLPAPAGSLVVVFVSYCNYEVGGGYPSFVTDSLGDYYTLYLSTNFDLNHTEALYVGVVSAGTALTVSVTFAAGEAPMGGSVAAVDLSNATIGTIDAVDANYGVAGPANVTFTTAHSGDLVLFGAAGRGASGPYSASAGETLLDTGTGTAGPFEDGVGYGTFEEVASSSMITASANLNTPTYWEAIGIAFY